MAEHFELRERDVARHLHAVQAVVPLVPDIRHRVPDCNKEDIRAGLEQVYLEQG